LDARSVLTRTAAGAARGRAATGIVAALERAARPRAEVLAVLTYHRVSVPAPSPSLYPGLISAEPHEFEEQMRFFASRSHPLSLSELLAVRRGEGPLPSRSILVTFDDAYRDFAEVAWPILERHGIPVTLFVPTAFPGDRSKAFWWDRLYGALAAASPRTLRGSPMGEIRLGARDDRINAFRRLRDHVKSLPHEEAMETVDELCAQLDAPPSVSSVLTWHELRDLHARGVSLVPHSRTHPLLDRVPADVARAEVVESLRDLEWEVGPVPRVFAYPGGGVRPVVRAILEQERFELAFLTERGTNDLRNPDWLRLRRINVGRASGLTLIRAQLLPWWPRIR
jgi:peptidoglycan/xylan/chitin deacetylase (PgdA/CDA1 family)